MGAYLSQPVTQKDSHEGENDTFKFGVACMQGWRTEMEDAHLIEPAVDNDNSVGVFAVFDGHGGKEVAAFAAIYMVLADASREVKPVVNAMPLVMGLTDNEGSHWLMPVTVMLAFMSKVRELLATEGYRSGDMEGALREVFLRIDDLLVKEEHADELSQLARVPNPSDERRYRNMRGERQVPDNTLPTDLREVLAGARAEVANRWRIIDTAVETLGDGEMEIPEADGDSAPPFIEEIEEMEESIEKIGEEIVADFKAVSHRVIVSTAEDGVAPDTAPSSEEESPKEGDGEGRAGLKPKRKRDGESEVTAKRNGNTRKDVSEDEDLPNGVAHAASDAVEDGDAVAEEVAEEEAETSDTSSSASSEGESGDEGPGIVGVGGRGGRHLPNGGCTAVAAMVRGEDLYVANAGDSRCVFSRKGRAVAMTTDHKPTDPLEHARITKAGGFVADGRVNASLNLSRALGDLEYKQSSNLGPEEQMVTAVPEIRRMRLQPGDDFLLLACDGIWDVLTNQEAVDFVSEKLHQGMAPKAICEALCDRCMAPDTETDGGKGCDNMSAMVVVLKPFCSIPKAVAPKAAEGPGGTALGPGPSSAAPKGRPSAPAARVQASA